MSTDGPDSNDDLESYALFERQYVVSRVVGLFPEDVDQGAAKLNDCKGLSMERLSNSARPGSLTLSMTLEGVTLSCSICV